MLFFSNDNKTAKEGSGEFFLFDGDGFFTSDIMDNGGHFSTILPLLVENFISLSLLP